MASSFARYHRLNIRSPSMAIKQEGEPSHPARDEPGRTIMLVEPWYKCYRCKVKGEHHIYNCPTNCDVSYDIEPSDGHSCTKCGKQNDHYADFCSFNMDPLCMYQIREHKRINLIHEGIKSIKYVNRHDRGRPSKRQWRVPRYAKSKASRSVRWLATTTLSPPRRRDICDRSRRRERQQKHNETDDEFATQSYSVSSGNELHLQPYEQRQHPRDQQVVEYRQQESGRQLPEDQQVLRQGPAWMAYEVSIPLRRANGEVIWFTTSLERVARKLEDTLNPGSEWYMSL